MLDGVGFSELDLPAALTSVFPALLVAEPERLVGRVCVLADPMGTGFVSIVSISRVPAPNSFSDDLSALALLCPTIEAGLPAVGLNGTCSPAALTFAG